MQVSCSLIGPSDVIKVIDQGADEATNASCLRLFFARVGGIRTTTDTAAATIIQTRHRIPEVPLRGDQIIVFQVPEPSRCAGSSRASRRPGSCTPSRITA